MADSTKQDNFNHLKEDPFSIAVDSNSTKIGDSFLAVTVRCITSERVILPQTRHPAKNELNGLSASTEQPKKIRSGVEEFNKENRNNPSQENTLKD